MKKAWKWLTKPSKPTAVGRWWKNVRAHTHTDDLAARLGAATGRTIARGVNLARARRGLPPIPIKGTWTNPRGKSGGGKSGGGKPQGAGPVKVVPGKKLDDYKHTGFWPKWMVSSNKGILKGGGGGGSGGGYVPPPPHPKLPPEPPARKGDDWWGHRQQSLMGPGGKNVKTTTDVTPTKPKFETQKDLADHLGIPSDWHVPGWVGVNGKTSGPNTTDGGIVIPDSAKEKTCEGTVVANRNSHDIGGAGLGEPVTIGVGSVVYFGKYAGTEVTVSGERLLVLSEDDVLVVL